MSGIIGVWNLAGRPVEVAGLDRLSAALAHRGPDAEGRWACGAVGLACRLLRITPEAATETQPLVHPSGAVLVFDGRLDNREALLSELGASAGVTAAAPDPALVLAAHAAFGQRFPERLAGDFALGLFDSRRQELLLARDVIGIRPLYYCRTGDTFLFASEIKALLAHPGVSPRPNDDLLADLLLDGAGDTQGMTFFQGVWSLLPAHMAIVTPQRFVARRYWDFDPSRQMRLGSFQEYAEVFRDHFERAVRRRLRSAYPVAVSVSGGLDSSSIFCVAETLIRGSRGRYPPLLGISNTAPDGTPSDEKAFLLEIERKYGVAIERVPVILGLLNDARQEVWHVEAPILDDQWNTTHTFHRIVHELGARVLLTGHWGDQVLFPQGYLIDLFRRLAWGEVQAHLREFGRWFTDADPAYFRRRFFLDLVRYSVPGRLFPFLRMLRFKPRHPWYSAALRKHARRHALRQTPIKGSFATTHARSLYEEARSSHYVLCMEWNNKVGAMHRLEMAFPFLDRDLVSFLMAIPGEMQTWKGVPKALLREALRGVLPDAIIRRTWKADFSHVVNEGMETEFPQVLHYLQAGKMAASSGYVNDDVLSEELERSKDRLQAHNCGIAWSLSDLLGLELWLQVFFGGTDWGCVNREVSETKAGTTVQGGVG